MLHMSQNPILRQPQDKHRAPVHAPCLYIEQAFTFKALNAQCDVLIAMVANCTTTSGLCGGLGLNEGRTHARRSCSAGSRFKCHGWLIDHNSCATRSKDATRGSWPYY